MRYANDGGILINCYLAQQVHHDSGALRIERRGGLISENCAGPVSQRASNRHALGFAARELSRHRVLAVPDFKIVEQVNGAAVCGRRADPGNASTTVTLSLPSRSGNRLGYWKMKPILSSRSRRRSAVSQRSS